MSQIKILVAEDEASLAHIVGDYLVHHSMQWRWVERGDQVMAAFQEYRPDLVLLDVMLPGRDGLSLCREIRQVSQTPVLMVTAKSEEIDRLLGLELGADDYICKPFSPRELVARIKVVLRRTQIQCLPIPSLGGFRIDEASQCIYCQQHRLDLTPTEFRLLRLFLSHPGRVFSRDQIMQHTYELDQDVTDRAVDSHIKNIRKKVARADGPREFIHAVYGVGYRFELV